MQNRLAILTGDLVGSTAATPRVVTHTLLALRDCAERVAPDTRFTPFRGDGWQIMLSTPGDCLTVCLKVLALLRQDPDTLPTRIAVGIGTGTLQDSHSLATASGTAFTASGRALGAMGRGQVLTIAGDGVDAFQKTCFAFAQDHARRWSREQAAAIALALHHPAPTQDQIAAMLCITRQAVGARLRAGGFAVLTEACRAFQDGYSSGTRGHDD